MLEAINSVGLVSQKNHAQKSNGVKSAQNFSQNATSVYSKAASQALKLNSLNLASTIRFTGALQGAFKDLNQSMVTCKTKDDKGESVGSRANVNKLLHDFAGDFSRPDDAIKTTVQIGDKSIGKDEHGSDIKIPVLARTQIKLIEEPHDDIQKLMFQMAVRKHDKDNNGYGVKTKDLEQDIQIFMTPINYKGEGTREQAYVLNTKGKLMAVVEDGNDVLLANAGKIYKKDQAQGYLEIVADEDKNIYKPFTPSVQKVENRKPMPSVGDGTEIVIGMEKGRFTKEIKASIQEFVNKIEKEEIVLPQFVAAPNAKDVQLIMLAGGFGSRAEYTNASSGAIFHDREGGAQSTKGVFRTATGLTPMETTLVTLHKAGLLDCSKGKIGLGKNIKFYLNEGQNRGNGEFSADLYSTMKRDGRKYAMIFPNDSMSRMTSAVIEANKKMQSGKAAIAMVAKKVNWEQCVKNFGIMHLAPDGEILAFKEKPEAKDITDDYKDKEGNCLTNTFQFAVSDEAFKVLDMFEELFIPEIDKKSGKPKELRDWSKQYVPIIKTLTQDKDYATIRKNLSEALNNKPEVITDELITKSKEILGEQKIYAIPTAEPWADCGTLNQLYHTTMQIVSGAFPLEDFERANALECVDTQTGLVASTAKQKERITQKYHIDGEVMVVPQAKVITEEEVADIPVTVHRD